jgi:16S rRNA (adenine1518-N6/adenine1519-N6)-dimethyltransferase
MYIKPKKRLGQNFLTDKNVQRKIMEGCAFTAQDAVLEIGPGTGIMTALLVSKVKKVYAVELDQALFSMLEASFKDNPAIELIHQDILKCNIGSLVEDETNKIKVFGNIPYYITSPIIAHLLGYKDRIDSVFLTVQKEFAKRIIAKPGSKDYGSFSCFVQYYTDAQLLFVIPKGCFRPPPKVDSAFIRLKILSSPAVAVENERLFFKVIRAAFNQRRKTLRNSLSGVVPQSKLEAFFSRYGVEHRIRPEDLSVQDFARLANG